MALGTLGGRAAQTQGGFPGLPGGRPQTKAAASSRVYSRSSCRRAWPPDVPGCLLPGGWAPRPTGVGISPQLPSARRRPGARRGARGPAVRLPVPRAAHPRLILPRTARPKLWVRSWLYSPQNRQAGTWQKGRHSRGRPASRGRPSRGGHPQGLWGSGPSRQRVPRRERGVPPAQLRLLSGLYLIASLILSSCLVFRLFKSPYILSHGAEQERNGNWSSCFLQVVAGVLPKSGQLS